MKHALEKHNIHTPELSIVRNVKKDLLLKHKQGDVAAESPPTKQVTNSYYTQT